MKRNKYLIFKLLLIVSVAASACLQNTDNQILLNVENENGESFELKKNDLAAFPRVTINATDKNGTSSLYEGVDLVEVLRAAKVPFGDDLRGRNVTNYVIAEGADGYKVSFTLAELDPDFSNMKVVLADKRDGQTLSGEEGGLRLVVPNETKRKARWLKQVVKLKVSAVE